MTIDADRQAHVALDELRMQMFGVQALFGFQLQGTFQERFSGISPLAHWADFCALSLLVLTLGLLIAVPSRHRLVERGTVRECDVDAERVIRH